jgi:hypothetical protein
MKDEKKNRCSSVNSQQNENTLDLCNQLKSYVNGCDKDMNSKLRDMLSNKKGFIKLLEAINKGTSGGSGGLTSRPIANDIIDKYAS